MKQTVAMAKTTVELEQARKKLDGLIERSNALNDTDLKTDEGKKARSDAFDRIAHERDVVSGEIRALASRLEIETVAMLAGDDQNFQGLIPADGD